MNSSAVSVMVRFLSSVAVVTPAESDAAIGDLDDSVVGDSDPVGVPTEVVEYLLRSTKRWFRIDDPLGLTSRFFGYGMVSMPH